MRKLNLRQGSLAEKRRKHFDTTIVLSARATDLPGILSKKGITPFLIILFLLMTGKAIGQPLNMEVMPGNTYLLYQHSITKRLDEKSRFSVRHLTNVLGRYNSDANKGGMTHELMNQAYVGFHLSRFLSFHAGGFYTKATDLRPSAAIQLTLSYKDLLVVIVPRFDIIQHGAFDVFTLLEYKPKLTEKVKLYSRIQTMSNFGPLYHNRSYQQFRLGVDTRSAQFGIGLNLDEYGRMIKMYSNWGVFIKKEIY